MGDIIHLAASLPKGDKSRRRLLKKLALMSIGDTEESRYGLRVHLFRGSIQVWDLTNAGKRGKKVEHFSVMGPYGYTAEMVDLADDLLKVPYTKAVQIAKDFAANTPGWEFYARVERGIDVTPQGFKPISIRGKNVHIRADYKDFSIKDLEDRYNEPTCIPTGRGSSKSVKQFFRWVMDNQSKIKNMSFREVLNALDKEGISYHYYCAMD